MRALSSLARSLALGDWSGLTWSLWGGGLLEGDCWALSGGCLLHLVATCVK